MRLPGSARSVDHRLAASDASMSFTVAGIIKERLIDRERDTLQNVHITNCKTRFRPNQPKKESTDDMIVRCFLFCLDIHRQVRLD